MQATIMTDPGTADRTYIGPMTPELVEEIIEKVLPAFRRRIYHSNSAAMQIQESMHVCRSGQMLFYQPWEGRLH